MDSLSQSECLEWARVRLEAEKRQAMVDDWTTRFRRGAGVIEMILRGQHARDEWLHARCR